jgi:hypothetical protein
MQGNWQDDPTEKGTQSSHTAPKRRNKTKNTSHHSVEEMLNPKDSPFWER